MLTFRNLFSVSLNCIRLTADNSRKQSGLILHHGMLGSARNLRPLCRNSKLLDYVDVLLIDARNHGQSPHTTTHSVGDLSTDIAEFIEQEKNNYKKFTLLGHSMGGLAVMEFTKNYKQLQNLVQRVIIVDIPCNPVESKGSWGQVGELEMLQDASKIDLSQSTSAILRQIQKISIDSNHANLIKFNLKILSNNTHKWKSNVPVIVKYYHQLTTYTLTNCEWKGPVQVIYGSKSEYFEEDQIDYFIQQYPQMTQDENFHRIEGAGHWVHFDKKQEFLNTVEALLQRNLG